jgi:hypothetical protein
MIFILKDIMNFIEKYKKEELEELIFIKKLSYREIGRIYGVSDTYIKKVANKLGISLNKRKKIKDGVIPHNKGKGKKINCQNCGGEIYRPWHNQKYCSRECNNEFKVNKKYDEYLNNQNLYYNSDISIIWIKKHILNEQNGYCQICGIKNEWNNKPLVFVLDHINGNANDNTRINLRLICHNCDSQLDTYKSKNKNSSRKDRYLKNYKN